MARLGGKDTKNVLLIQEMQKILDRQKLDATEQAAYDRLVARMKSNPVRTGDRPAMLNANRPANRPKAG